MRIAIHQPNLFPFAGYFEKIRKVDRFVFLNRCQFEKGGYQNRFNIGEEWFTMSVNSGLQPIGEKYYTKPVQDWEKIKAKLPQYKSILNSFDPCISESLMGTNINIILMISAMLKIRTGYSMDLPTDLTATDRLVKICQDHGATTYVSGPSGKDYMDMEAFDRAGIEVEFHENKDKRPILEVLNEII